MSCRAMAAEAAASAAAAAAAAAAPRGGGGQPVFKSPVTCQWSAGRGSGSLATSVNLTQCRHGLGLPGRVRLRVTESQPGSGAATRAVTLDSDRDGIAAAAAH
jgi:hypothetical protein